MNILCLMKKINFKQKKYVVPAILFVYTLVLGYLVTDLFLEPASMSKFIPFIYILTTVYIVYYTVMFCWELRHPHSPHIGKKEYNLEDAFGVKTIYVSPYDEEPGDEAPEIEEPESVVPELEYEDLMPLYDTTPVVVMDDLELARRSLSDYSLGEWIYYCCIGFEFDAEFDHLLICLNINRRTYRKPLYASDIRDIVVVSDEGRFTSDVSSWWKRKDLAVKYFRDEIISEHEMVEVKQSYGLGREVPFNPMLFDIRDIVASDLWFEISECNIVRCGYDIYKVYACIKDGPILNAKISDDDLDIYLEKDLDGQYKKNIPPENFVVKYLLNHISREYPKHEGIVEEVDSYELTGEPPVFRYDDNLHLSLLMESEALTDTRVLCVKDGILRRYYLETSIYGIHRAVMLNYDVVSEILEINEKLDFTHRITPEDVACFYWGHEFKYLKNGCIPENPQILIKTLKDIVSLPEEYDVVDYPKTDYFSVLHIKKEDVRIYQEKIEDDLTDQYVYNLRIGIGSSNFWYRLTINDICNYLERDECGRFTRRVSIEQLASNHIKMYAGVVKMYKAGVPQTVIIEATGVSKHYIRKIINNLALNKPRTHLSELKAAKRQQIREDFVNGVDLTDLRFKYGLKEYKTLYKLLGSMVSGQNAVVPREFEEFVKITTP